MEFTEMSMKPMMIVPPNLIGADDLQRLRDNGICVVEATEPEKVKFFDPIPAANSRTQIEHAAIQLTRKILKGDASDMIYRRDCIKNFVDFLVVGSPLDPQPSAEDRAAKRQQIGDEERDQAYWEEMRRIGREEAKADRAAKKAGLEKKKANEPKNPGTKS